MNNSQMKEYDCLQKQLHYKNYVKRTAPVTIRLLLGSRPCSRVASESAKHAWSDLFAVYLISRERSFALTMLGDAFGISLTGPSTNGAMSELEDTGCPWSLAATLHAASVAMPPRVHNDADAMCGTMTALAQSARPGFIAGSSSNTSSPA